MKKTSLYYIVTLLLLINLNGHSSTAKPPKKSYIATIYTRLGEIELLLFDDTPKHRDNFLKLAESNFYDSTTFHRVLQDFMIQGGDPNSKPNAKGKVGTGGPGYTIKAEIIAHYKHTKGMLAAARKGDKTNPDRASSGSQFYIVQNATGAHHLDGAYTIFGQVLKGIDVVDAIASVAVSRKGLPDKDIRMRISIEKMKRKKISKQYQYTFIY